LSIGEAFPPSGAEARFYLQPFAARLKPCPVTKHSGIESGMSFS
jgi:hypothetical protein